VLRPVAAADKKDQLCFGRPPRAASFMRWLDSPYPGIQIDAADTICARPGRTSCSADLVKKAKPL
jgi:hypothetical protein